ncbi:MAG: hypothetical protein HY846_02215 [Nitrosomonadales bacterium]|nr:hypothetical protein [Nitrosomonadales bacterium]
MGFTLFTVAAGWYAYNTVSHDAPSYIAMTEHRNWTIVTFVLFLGAACWEYSLSRQGNSNFSSKMRQGGDKRATKTAQVARPRASARANAVSLMNWNNGRGWLFTGLLVIAAGTLLSTAWHGGELVYRHGLGVMSLPKPEGAGHPNEHGAGHDHGNMPMQGADMPHEDAHAHIHGDTSSSGHPHDAESGRKAPVADGAGTAPKKAGHTHAPGSLPHKD